jgi:hypothetical protein
MRLFLGLASDQHGHCIPGSAAENAQAALDMI